MIESTLRLYFSESYSMDAITLRDLHHTLCHTITLVNNYYGWQLLSVMLSIFIHLVCLPFYVVLSETNDMIDLNNRTLYFTVQASWIILNLIQLLSIVRSCSATTNQVTEQLCQNKPFTWGQHYMFITMHIHWSVFYEILITLYIITSE